MQRIVVVSAAVALLLTSVRPSQAAIEFDKNVTNNAIFGSGNANGGFTIERANGVELGLRAKVRFPTPLNVFNSNGDGTYDHAGGTQPPDRALWSFEWSINSDYLGVSGLNLDDLTYEIRLDYDAGLGTNFQTFDPINVAFADHSIGDNSTAQGAGAEAAHGAGYLSLIANNNLAQNSWQLNFFDSVLFPFDPNVAGTYDFELEAYLRGDSVASTRIQVLVDGGAAVPEATTFAVWSVLGLCGGGLAWRAKKKQPTA
jgi:hypothetical protein